MTVVLDTGVVVALLDPRERDHEAAAHWVRGEPGPLVTTPLAVAEMDHMARVRGGEHAQRAFWRDLEVDAYTVRWWADALGESLRIARQHPHLGLTDCSLLALADRLRTRRLATFDQHFRSTTNAAGEGFVLLPADE